MSQPDESIFKKLALALDRIPNGYPATESGVELKILAKLFTPEEAELASQLAEEAEPVKSIAGRLGMEERAAFVLLKSMVKKGLIEMERGQGGLAFKLIPFIVGFYENQNARIDAEFARLFEAYYHESLHTLMTLEPSVHRVIPMEKVIPVNLEVMPYQRASHYMEQAQSWGVLNCICRVQKRLVGQGCDHSLENCLVFSKRSRAFDKVEGIRAISREQALDVLRQAHEEGLVHSVANSQQGVNYICNCCSCCCGVMRGVVEYGKATAIAQSDFFVAIEETRCTGCGACVDRCPFGALSVKGERCTVDPNRCYGCGACIPGCPAEALTLKMKEKAVPPPLSQAEWRLWKMDSRKSQ